MASGLLEPLYKSVPRAARADAQLYEWLALVDAVRAGRARERELTRLATQACRVLGRKRA